MPFISENRLEEALVKAVKQPATAGAFWRLLLDSDLLVLGSAEGHEADNKPFSLQPGGKFNLVTGMKGGKTFLPVFSSLVRMQEFLRQESRYLSINGRALLDMTRGAPVILNPASEYGRELTAEHVAHLLGDAQPRAARTMIGTAELPPDLVALLTPIFARHPEVATAWMIQATFPNRPPNPVVGIELDEKMGGDMKALAAEIGDAAAEAALGTIFDLQQVVRNNPQGLAQALLQAPPFYQRNMPADPGRTLN